jgi:membrane-bound metal-dependent hydrolase YbcI (DUF457 family)
MFVLGHVGVSLGVIYLLAWYYTVYVEKEHPKLSLIAGIDFRLVAISAMFPDIVDKIVGMWIFGEEVANGRIFTHSLIIISILSISLLNLAKIKFTRLSLPSLYLFPAFIHLLLDGLWEEPGTLFWPLLGTGFPKMGVEFGDYFEILLTNPVIYIGEIIGSIIMVLMFIRFRLYVKNNFVKFFKKGQIS